MQPSSANKLPIVHILGLLSNLFSTFDLNKQNERMEVMRPVQTQPHNNNPVRQPIKTQTPISYCWLASMFESNRPVKWTPNSCSGRFSGGGCPAAGLPSDPDHSQQVAEWTGGGRGQCPWTCVCLWEYMNDSLFSCLISGGVCCLWEITEDPSPWLCTAGDSALWAHWSDVQRLPTSLGFRPHTTSNDITYN